MSKFTADDVRRVVCCIPHGRATTFGDVARALGHRPHDAAQAVAACVRTLGERFSLEEVPVHRVTKAEGEITGDAAALQEEGVELHKRGEQLWVSDFGVRYWDPCSSE